MNIELVLFWVFGALTLGSALGVLIARNPINSAMSLVATFFFLAGLYVLLLAHTVAVLQVLVYAGAIMVLFLFVIMLLNLSDATTGGARVTPGRVAGGAAAVGLFGVLALAISKRPDAVPAALQEGAARGFGTLASVGAQIYTQWLFPFEAVSLLLLVAMVGAVVVAKSRI